MSGVERPTVAISWKPHCKMGTKTHVATYRQHVNFITGWFQAAGLGTVGLRAPYAADY